MNEEEQGLTFGKTDHLYSITKGYVLVKKNIITGSIRAIGSYEEKKISEKVPIELGKLSDRKLEQTLRRIRSKGNRPQDEQIIQAEIERRINGLPPQPGISNVKVLIPTKNYIIQRKISSKLGIRFRWPWQSALVLPTTERKIDTPMMSVDTTDGIRLQFDTDYHYKITDPEAFATEFNSREDSYGAKAFAMLEKDIGGKIDEIVRKYMKEHINEIQSKPSINLLSELSTEVAFATNMYGIQVTNLLVKDIKLPDSVVQAEAARKAAEAQAEASRRQLEVEASKSAMEMQAQIKAIQDLYPGLSPQEVLEQYIKMTSAKTITTNINPGVIAAAPQPVQAAPQPVQVQPAPVDTAAPQPQPAPTDTTGDQQQPAPVDTAAPQPVRPANAQEWFDDYVGWLYDESGKIYQDKWDAFVAVYPNLPATPLKITALDETLTAELFGLYHIVIPPAPQK